MNNSKKVLHLSFFSVLILFILPNTVYAVPPPDFLFNLGAQVAQFFSIAVLFLSAIFGVSYKYIQTRLALMKSKKLLFWSLAILVIGGIAGGTAYIYANYKQSQQYQTWLAESQKYAQLPQQEANFLDSKKVPRDPTPATNNVDGLTIGENAETKAKIERSSATDEKFIANLEGSDTDKTAIFLKDYYQSIALGNFEKAYEMSKKSVDLATFKSWYSNTTKITLDQLSRINDQKSSIELTIYEGTKYTRYGVLMDLRLDNGTPVQIVSSDVRVLSEGQIESTIATTPTGETKTIITEDKTANTTSSNFFEANKSTALSITNQNFQKALNGDPTKFVVIDARENLEYNNGYLPGSNHIRFADLQAGQWIEVPNDKFVYVLCWSGIRGKEVATFLRTKNIVASYLENGANGWFDFGGKWVGNIKFGEKYTGDQFTKLYPTAEVKNKTANGVVLVDSRQPWKFEKSHIPGSVNIPIMYTPSIKIEETFAQLPVNSKVITICDDYVNCFDAKITGVELENRGQTFLGRYATPWEYGQ